MVRGRRKRAQTRNGITARSAVPPLEKEEMGSPAKKETKMEGNKKAQNGSSFRARTPNDICKPSACIRGFLCSPVTELSSIASAELPPKDPDPILHTETFFSSKEIIEAQTAIVTDAEHFCTDETPVAVPVHGPSTPHRINMPNSQLEDSDESNTIEKEQTKPVINGTSHLTPSHMKKPGTRGRRKNVGAPANQGSRLNEHAANNLAANHKLTDYFPVRRSVRKSKKAVLEEKQRDMENKVLCQSEEGLEVRTFHGKGRGVVTTREFLKGEFVVEYIGQLIDQVTAKKREKIYAQDQNTGCYMYYFQHRNHQYCIDATAETGKLGRLVNHSRNGNLIARIVEVESTPHLVLTAKEDIPMGVEVSYDYGDRSREAIRHHPWLAL